MLNETIQITQEQMMKIHYSNTVPTLIFLYLVAIFTFLFVGLKVVKKSRNTYFQIWIYSSIIIGLFLVFLIIFPNTTQAILNYFGGLAH